MQKILAALFVLHIWYKEFVPHILCCTFFVANVVLRIMSCIFVSAKFALHIFCCTAVAGHFVLRNYCCSICGAHVEIFLFHLLFWIFLCLTHWVETFCTEICFGSHFVLQILFITFLSHFILHSSCYTFVW